MKNNPKKKISGKSAEAWQEALWDKLIDELSRIKEKQELKKVIESLLSTYEKNFLLRRLAATALVKQGATYKEIGEVLWISPATISAIKKNILNRGASYKSTNAFKKTKSAGSAGSTPSSSNKAVDFIEQAVSDFISAIFALGGIAGNRQNYFSNRIRKGK